MKLNFKSLFLENLGIRQTIFKNTFWLSLSEVVVQILKLALIIYTARILGAEEYGKFSFALSFVCLFVIFAELGLSDIITREFSKNKESENEYPSIISLKIFLSLGVFLIMYLGSFFITKEPDIRISIWFLAIFILITSFINIFYAFFRARQKMEHESFFKIIQYVVLTLFSFLVLFIAPSIQNLSFVYFFTNIGMLAVLMLFFHFFIKPIKLEYHKYIWKKFIVFSWPLILGFSIGWIYIPVSSVMLGYLGYHIENGWYSSAYKIIGSAVLSATLVSRSFFPALNVASKVSKEKIQKIWNYQKELMIILAFPMVVGGVVLAPKIIAFFYDSSFIPAVFVFQWLTVVFAIDILYYPYACALIIFGYEKKNFVLMLAGLVINIVVGIILIPVYGLHGVVISNVISLATVFFLSIIYVVLYTPIFPFNVVLFKTTLIVIVSSVIMFLVIRILNAYNFHLILLITIGALAYFFPFTIIYSFFNKSVFGKVKHFVANII